MDINLDKLYGLSLEEAAAFVAPFGFEIRNYPIENPDPAGYPSQFFVHSEAVAQKLKENPKVIGVWERAGKIVTVFGRYDPEQGSIV